MSKGSDYSHTAVLTKQLCDLLAIRPDGLYVDCTLGGGGHAAAILAKLGNQGRLIGIDQDSDALAAAKAYLSSQKISASYQLVLGNFTDLDQILDQLRLDKVDGIIADLGVSSWQLDSPGRGFGYQQDGPLDMRMDRQGQLTAAEIVNSWPARDIARILRDYGEERYAVRISRAIAEERELAPFVSTQQLASTIRAAMPAAARREQQHPARRSFQALRIAVNDELAALEKLLQAGPARLKAGGRICLISFHSLEDRLVKQAFRRLEKPCICPRDLPVCSCGRLAAGQAWPRKSITASAEETAINQRSRSARLRCFIRGENELAQTEVDYGFN